MSLADKLRPDRFSAMSGRLAAIVAFILDETWTDPEIAWMSVTEDGYVSTESDFIGLASELDRNLRSLLTAAGLTRAERAEFDALYSMRVDDHRADRLSLAA